MSTAVCEKVAIYQAMEPRSDSLCRPTTRAMRKKRLPPPPPPPTSPSPTSSVDHVFEPSRVSNRSSTSSGTTTSYAKTHSLCNALARIEVSARRELVSLSSCSSLQALPASVLSVVFSHLAQDEAKLWLGTSKALNLAAQKRLLTTVVATNESIQCPGSWSVVSYPQFLKMTTTAPLPKFTQLLVIQSPGFSQDFLDQLVEHLPRCSVTLLGSYTFATASLDLDYEWDSGTATHLYNHKWTKYQLDPVPMPPKLLALYNVGMPAKYSNSPQPLAIEHLALWGRIDPVLCSNLVFSAVTRLTLVSYVPEAHAVARQLDNVREVCIGVEDPVRFLREVPSEVKAIQVVFAQRPSHTVMDQVAETHSETLESLEVRVGATVMSDPWLDAHPTLTEKAASAWHKWLVSAGQVMKADPVKYPKLRRLAVNGVSVEVGRVFGDWAFVDGIY
ncbi:hypothetical protein DICA0_E06568 [Diutina catenulata]